MIGVPYNPEQTCFLLSQSLNANQFDPNVPDSTNLVPHNLLWNFVENKLQWVRTRDNIIVRELSGGGGGGGDTFINTNPSTVSVGGYPAGTTFPTPKTMQEMWDGLLYPYVPPAFTSFLIDGQPTLIEVGAALSGIKQFNWGISQSVNVQANSIAIRDVNANIILASGLPNTGSVNADIGIINNTVPMSQSWRGEAINSQAAPFQSGNFTVTSIYPVFYGKVASGGAPPGANRPVANQALIDSGTKLVIPSTGTITLNFNTNADEYMWFAIPDSSPAKTKWFVNALNNGNIGGAIFLHKVW